VADVGRYMDWEGDGFSSAVSDVSPDVIPSGLQSRSRGCLNRGTKSAAPPKKTDTPNNKRRSTIGGLEKDAS